MSARRLAVAAAVVGALLLAALWGWSEWRDGRAVEREKAELADRAAHQQRMVVEAMTQEIDAFRDSLASRDSVERALRDSLERARVDAVKRARAARDTFDAEGATMDSLLAVLVERAPPDLEPVAREVRTRKLVRDRQFAEHRTQTSLVIRTLRRDKFSLSRQLEDRERLVGLLEDRTDSLRYELTLTREAQQRWRELANPGLLDRLFEGVPEVAIRVVTGAITCHDGGDDCKGWAVATGGDLAAAALD